MSATLTVLNGNTRLRFNYKGVTARITALAEDSAHELWNRGMGDHGTLADPILWESLTQEQRLAILNDYVKGILKSLSKDFYVNNAVDNARDIALADIDTVYDIIEE